MKGGSLLVQASPARWSRNPSVSVCQLVVVVGSCIQFQWIFFEDSTHLPISWWVIYEHICPLLAECSAGFFPKRAWPPCPTLPIHLISPSAIFFWGGGLFVCFPDEKVLKGKHFADVERGETNKQKNGRSTKRHQNQWVQKLFWAIDMCAASNGEYFEGDWSLKMEEYIIF